jgi:serine/threonine-protein kinase
MHPGEIVAGKYRVVKILGRTHGVLLEARHTEFDQRVVVRLLSPALCDDKELERFRREAQTLSKLESEHVARIIDVGTHSDGSFYLVRQFLDGVDLGTQLRAQGALRLEEAVLYTLQAGEALQECHSHKILLRELQPSSLFLTKRRGGASMVKIIDFGTAKLLKDTRGQPVGGEMSQTVMFGMSRYTSPEVLRKAKGIDGRTDVWSLGCIFYEMLSAVPAFHGEMAELLYRITREEPLPLSSLRPDLPRELDQIVAWALAKEPESRFQNVYALAHALKPYAPAEGQVLVDRIGHLAHAEPESVRMPAKISPTSPLARGRELPALDDEDSATVIRSSPLEEEEFERTRYLDDGIAARRPSQAPPAPAGMAGGMPQRSSVPTPAPRGSHPGQMPMGYPGQDVSAPAGGLVASPAATGGFPAQTATGANQRVRQRRGAVYAVAASLVLIPVLIVVLVIMLKGGGGGDQGKLASNTAPAASASTRTPGGSDTPKTADDTAAGGEMIDLDDVTLEPGSGTTVRAGGGVPRPAGPLPSGRPSAAPNGDDKSKDNKPPDASSKAPPAKSAEDKVPPPPPTPPPEKKPEPPDAGDTGTLVAIAIGGSCQFKVDGASQGTTSSLRIQTKVGTHTVSCTTANGTRSQKVTVKPGKPGMATFKLN